MTRYILLAVLTIFIGLTAYGQPTKDKLKNFDFNANRHNETIVVDGVKRSFIVQIPKIYDGKSVLPIIFMFHGTSGTGEKFWNISRWKELGEKEGFISIYPTALKHRYYDEGKIKNKTKWNDGKLETYIVDPSELKDDVKFVKEIIKTVAKQYKIDRKRIYASGFSNGGGFVSRLAVDMPNTFAAIAAASGSLNIKDAKPKTLIPYYLISGSKEYTDKKGQPAPKTPKDLAENEFLNTRFDLIRKTFQLGEKYTSKQGKNHITLRYAENLGSGDNVFIYSMVRGLEHRYPNGKNNPAGFVAAKHFWKFFQKYHK